MRGLLCSSCNGGLGLFKDDIQFLKQAIEYLNKGDSVAIANETVITKEVIN